MVGVRLDVDVDWNEVAGIVEDAPLHGRFQAPERRPRRRPLTGPLHCGEAAGPSTAGEKGRRGDETLEFVTPVFDKAVKPGKADTVSRRHKKCFRALDLKRGRG